MSTKHKDEASILKKLGITELNPMQLEAGKAISEGQHTILLSPTGTGKTLAFLLPILSKLDPTLNDTQVLILVPARELAIQIEQLLKEMGTGYKVNAVYGGRAIAKDKIELRNAPTILIGTPGRVADHMRRETIDTYHVKTLVLDEYDKSLEIGFEEDMWEIVDALPRLENKILTSATEKDHIPSFIGIRSPKVIDFLDSKKLALQYKVIVSQDKDKLESLLFLLRQLSGKNGIVFCNFRDSIRFVSEYLTENALPHACFHGGLEQQDRERALIRFRNGTHQVLLATDLAARGLDIPEMDYIAHYQLPSQEEEFIHRNGRTARMHQSGIVYILKWEVGDLPEFIPEFEQLKIKASEQVTQQEWETLFISGGRKDKISKGDIAGLFFKQGKLEKGELGIIELKQDCAFVSVPLSKANDLVSKLNNAKIKKRKVRIHILK